MIMGLNTETVNDDGSECRNWETVMDLNVETEKWWWLWMLKLRNDDGFERQNWEMMMDLNVETKKR